MEDERETESEAARKCGKERTYRNCIGNSQHIIPSRYSLSRDILVPFWEDEMLPGKHVGRGEGIKAEVILSAGGTVLREWSPARWVGELSKRIEIPVSETKQLIVAVRDSSPGGFWEMDFSGIPVGTRVGELKIRLLREDSAGTASLIATKFYKWKRAPDFFDFVIQPIE